MYSTWVAMPMPAGLAFTVVHALGTTSTWSGPKELGTTSSGPLGRAPHCVNRGAATTR